MLLSFFVAVLITQLLLKLFFTCEIIGGEMAVPV